MYLLLRLFMEEEYLVQRKGGGKKKLHKAPARRNTLVHIRSGLIHQCKRQINFLPLSHQ